MRKRVRLEEPCAECPAFHECWNYGKQSDPDNQDGKWRIVGWFECFKAENKVADDNVIKFEPKLLDGGKAEAQPKPVAIACHCSSTNFELASGGAIRCSRCGCAFGGSWKWSAAQ